MVRTRLDNDLIGSLASRNGYGDIGDLFYPEIGIAMLSARLSIDTPSARENDLYVSLCLSLLFALRHTLFRRL